MSSRALRVAALALACLLLVVGGIGLWRWQHPAPDDAVPAEHSASASSEAAAATGAIAARIRLLPESGIGADPASVRIGIAQVSAQDAEAWRAWVRGGMQGAGPQAFADMATVTRWIAAPSRRLADGMVEAGPLNLPAADAYLLQARSDDRLRWYSARFEAKRIPSEVAPRIAAGLRVRVAAEAALTAAKPELPLPPLSLLLRRVEGSRDADWQPLLRQVAPELLAAYDDTPLSLNAGDTLAPLPPGPVEAVLLVGGAEVLRRRLDLPPGRVTALDVDEATFKSGTALATSLRLRFVDADNGRRLRPTEVLWIAPEGERSLGAEADGAYRIARADPARPLRFDLRLPPAEVDGLPAWPEQMPLVVRLDEETSGDVLSTAADGSTEILRTVKLQALRWLVVDGLPEEARLREDASPPLQARNLRTPPPVHVLERFGTADDKQTQVAGSRRDDTEDGWHAVAADRFESLPRAAAVSLRTGGRYRLMVAISPWHILRSTAVEAADGDRRSRYRASLAAQSRTPRTVRLRLIGETGGPLARTPVQVLDPAGALPQWTLSTDDAGWLTLENATEPAVLLEAQGHAQIRTSLQTANGTLRLSPERE